jgi:hypothetical protein
LGSVEADVAQFHKQQEEVSKYANMDSYDKEVKKILLKDPKLDPNKLQPYDGFMNLLYKWKGLATSDAAKKANPEQRQKAASNFYKQALVPIYQKMGAEPPKEKVWVDNAYDRALMWNMDDAYDNNWSRGYFEGFKQYENVMRTGIGVLGGIVKNPYVLFPYGEDTKKESTQHLIDESYKVPVIGSIMRSLDRTISHDSFWHDIQPNHHWGDGVQSFVAEQTMMMPLYFAGGGFSEGLLEGLGAGGGLTAKILAHPAGKLVGSLLTNGAEGAAYGYTMTDDEDRKDWWKMAVTQAVVGTALHYGIGGAVSGAGRVIKGITAASQAKKAAAEAASKGFKEAGFDDLKENLVKDLGGIMAAGGRPASTAYIKDAIKFVANTEHLTPEEYEQAVKNAIDQDKLHGHGITTIATYLKKYMEGMFDGIGMKNINENELQELSAHIMGIVEEAGDRVPETVDAVGQKAGADAVNGTKNGKNPEGKSIIDQWTEEEHEKNMKANLPDTPENRARARQMAEMRYAEANAKAAKKAAKENARKPVKEAVEVQDNKRGSSYAPDTPIGVRVSKPKYGYQGKNFELDFENERDKAAYIIGNRGKSAKHDAIAEWYTRGGPITEAEAHAQRVKDYIANAIKKGADPDEPIKIPKLGAKVEVKAPKVKTASQRVAPTVTYRTTSRVSKTGERSVSFNAKHSWIVYAKKAVAKAGLKWDSRGIQKWLYDMVDTDPRKFAEDLQEHFYPKDLKDQGIWFESQSTPTLGKEDPNFLAFMYNYTDQMPKEFAEALSYALEETSKFEGNFRGGKSTDLQKNEYAKNVWNHVAEMIHHPKFTSGEESHIYRSSFPNMREPSKWQGPKTIAEIEDNERKLIKGMFKGKPEARKLAMDAYEAAASARRKAIKARDPEARKAANYAIDTELIRSGERERMEF